MWRNANDAHDVVFDAVIDHVGIDHLASACISKFRSNWAKPGIVAELPDR
jgi:hypothetical protein